MMTKMSILISLYVQYRFKVKRNKYMLSDLFDGKYFAKIL